MWKLKSNIINLYNELDPRYVVTFLLFFYNVLGLTVLGFNRSISQIALTISLGISLHIFYDFIFNSRFKFNISSLTTSLGLCILVNYGHSLIYPVVPIFMAISSKFFFTVEGKHRFNPGMFGVASSLLLAPEFISSAPAYQWNGVGAMALFIIMPAVIFFMPKINRHYLVLSFLTVFILQLTLRSLLIRHYLPFTTLFFGSISSPAFFIFVFFMITDPATSPQGKSEQIKFGVALALIDLVFHLFSSYHTFFYAALTLGTFRFIKSHIKAIMNDGHLLNYFVKNFYHSGYYKKFAVILSLALGGYFSYQFFGKDRIAAPEVGFSFEKIDSKKSGLDFKKGEIFDQVDPQVQHMGKWFLAISDGIAVGDFDNSGMMSIFLTNGHKAAKDRNALFKNMGNFRFERIPSADLTYYASDFKRFGVPSNAMFVDIDNTGVLDLFVTYAFGKEGTSRLFCNQLKKTGKLEFKECTKEKGLARYSNSATANFLDFNNDGRLDLILGNTIATHLNGYSTPTHLDLFNLPKPQYPNDRRMFDFMHDSWHQAVNGGPNFLFIQNDKHQFEVQDPQKIGLPETKWTMAIATADFNQDGYTDLYMANDFGADDLYYNHEGKYFENYKGKMWGEVGSDTYKGMNATVADFDNNGMMDVQVSNVHHQLQAEGSLLWNFYPNKKDSFHPMIKDQATYAGALNENRFGWGAASADFANKGWIDMAQANGMVDNLYDKNPHQKKESDCPDYWYINEKIARSSPSIHRYVDNWGDIRGACIHGFEQNRLYFNRGMDKKPQFVDVADFVGMNEKANYRGMTAVDLNNDGHMDLIVTSLYRNPLVYKNVATENTKKRHWIGLSLQSLKHDCNRMAIGTKLWLHSINKSGKLDTQYFETTLVNGFSAQHDPRVHMGFFIGNTFDSLTVKWCGRFEKTYRDIKLDRYQKLVLTED